MPPAYFFFTPGRSRDYAIRKRFHVLAMSTAGTNSAKRRANRGKLRIGDDWNAITIIALSQNNPLKAVAEFVENSIDARARHITIVRGKEKGEPYLRITDDGQGIPRNEEGMPDFKYVATHICDSMKRRLKAHGAAGIQGEFGIGLLSFWTVGEELSITSSSEDGRTFQMRMKKGEPDYEVTPRRTLFVREGTEITVKPLLPGLRQLSGEKMQWYLASELRDRIRQAGVEIEILDRQARKHYRVEPRQFSGRLLHHLPGARCAYGEVYYELYLAEHRPENLVELHRSGTRVLEDLSFLARFDQTPWASGYLQGLIDAPFLQLTPGTRTGIVQDEAYSAFCESLLSLEDALLDVIEKQRKAEEERASRQVLKTIQKAFREAFLALPAEEYDWFDVRKRTARSGARNAHGPAPAAVAGSPPGPDEPQSVPSGYEQRHFFEHAGPLFSVRVSPTSCVMPVGQSRTLRAVPRDKERRLVEDRCSFAWRIAEGEGRLEDTTSEIVMFHAPSEPGLTRIEVVARQGAMERQAEAMITVTDSLLPPARESAEKSEGLPGYTFHRAPGELWRSRFDAEQNVVIINNGHRDFVYASRSKALKLRYICRLFAKELVLKNFPGIPQDQLLERMIELSLYTEEHLR